MTLERRKHRYIYILATVLCIMLWNIKSFAQSWDFNYTGGVQSWTCPAVGTYKLETWGAQGGNQKDSASGGKGGYACGYKYLAQGTILYIAVGGQGESISWSESGGTHDSSVNIAATNGGYNGGGKGGAGFLDDMNLRYCPGAGGGGATHIATTNRGILANYSSYQNELLLVAGGGGGAGGWAKGGSGGGESGESLTEQNNSVKGGTQTTGFAFGQGAWGDSGNPYDSDKTAFAWGDHNSVEGRGGSGGGWYGGERCTNHKCDVFTNIGGAGGSGHIGDVEDGSMQSGVREGNGFARITTVTYNVDLNIDHPTKGQPNDISGKLGWGYVKVSTDGKNWTGEITNEDQAMSVFYNRRAGEKVYIKYIRPYINYLEFGHISVTKNKGLTSLGNNTWSYIVSDNVEDPINNSVFSGGSIHINLQYKHTTLTIDPNGGTINGNSSPQVLSPQMQYSTGNWNNVAGNKPTRAGYTFEGWYDAASGGTKVYDAEGKCIRGTKYWDSNGNSLCVNDLTVYAHWKINTYNIYYTLYGSNTSLQRTYTVESNNFTLPTNPTLQGYTFKGWIGGIDQKDPVKKGNTYQTPTKNITVEKSSYGDYFFRAIFEKTPSVNQTGNRTDDVYIAQSIPHEKQY